MSEQGECAIPNVEPIMEEAMRELSDDVKREYLQALDLVPHLVKIETPKSKFLRTENNNPWAAARRLCLYWKYRKEIMSADRWLRPMNQTGRGALGTPEVTLLRRGIYHYTCTDETGPVVVVDGSRNHGASAEASGRILFYLGTILDDVAVQTTGITVVYAVTSADTTSHIDPRFGVYIALGLPAKVRRFVVVQNYEPYKESLIQFFAERRKLQIQVNYKKECDLIASDTSRMDLLRRVQQAGLPWQALPTSCGGHFDDSVLCEWMRKRISLEGVLNSCSPTQQLRLVRGEPVPPRRRRRRRRTTTNDNNNNNKRKAVVDWMDCQPQQEEIMDVYPITFKVPRLLSSFPAKYHEIGYEDER